MKDIFHGILPAVVTPLTWDNKFAPGPMESLLERLYTAGVHGVYVCGMTGEGLLQSVAMRQSVAEVAVKCSHRGKVVVVHVGAPKLSEALPLAHHARRIGAHAVSSLPPLGARNFAEIRQYYQRLAAASELPFLVYYMPAVYPGIATIEQILELCHIPNVIGLKFTDFDLYKLHSIKKANYLIFNGRDEVLVAGLLMGADGGIGSTYNLIPELYVELYKLAGQQRWEAARRLQDRANELIDIILRFPLLPAIKAMLAWSGIDCGPSFKRPQTLTAFQRSQLRNLLLKSSFAGYPFAGLGLR
jgi:N-acetylneuraminate lyase